MLAPRINAAGRMGNIELAIELFLTHDAERAVYLARALCDLNKQRQAVESQIYDEAVAMLRQQQNPEAIVLAGETWHQGVVGIVASRLAEEYSCPAFLICMDGDHGKASSRSYGGFSLFTALSSLAPLLESYGGHELAAGFTISRGNIDRFRQEICAIARDYYAQMDDRTVLDVDCAIPAELLSVAGIDSLTTLEPCGNGCPKPLLMMERLHLERIHMVGNGRHMRLRLRQGRHIVNGIFFSATPETASIQPGDLVDAAFYPQINEFRGERTPQLNVVDLRPSCAAPCSAESAAYRAMHSGALTPGEAEALLPSRSTLATVWRYLAAAPAPLKETPMCLCRKIVRWSGLALNLGQLQTCLDIFSDVGLLQIHRQQKYIHISLCAAGEKADLNQSRTMQLLLQAKEN
jgi:single-stranded-DNA-specific exonuclease